jgi:hypothetical protein
VSLSFDAKAYSNTQITIQRKCFCVIKKYPHSLMFKDDVLSKWLREGIEREKLPQ